MEEQYDLRIELVFLALLAVLWGSSYLFIKVAVVEIPPLTLIAARVLGAALFLSVIMLWRNERLPRGWNIWGSLLILAFFNSIGAWTLLAWGQQFVDAGLASVLNSTAPIYVFLITALVTRHEYVNRLKLLGACLGVLGVVLIVGIDALQGLGQQIAGQIACLMGAVLYAFAAIYSKRFYALPAISVATVTMIWASVALVPVALLFDKPWALKPTLSAIAAAAILSIFCTAGGLLIYFRLVRTIGSMGVASQAYLRAGVGVILGMIFLEEKLSIPVAMGLLFAITGVAFINWPSGEKPANS